MKTKLLVSSILLATAVVVYAYPGAQRVAQPAKPAKPAAAITAPAAKPLVEVVFVLDTTSSMSDLIQAAKDNIWSIARNMANAQPQPQLRIGLVAFRDRGDAYVTKVVDLSEDLDSMYATLMDFQAQGGGDGPESVNQALYDAVHKISWSQDDSAYQVVFLVGDAQPHMDYPDDVKYPVTIKAAAAKGIMINTIQAGENPGTLVEWQRIAALSQGDYFKVGQGGDAIALATPFDEEMARLAKELDATRLFYGNAEELERAAAKTAATDKLHASGSVSSLAQRAAFNASTEAGAANFLGERELVADLEEGRVDLAKLDADELPEQLRELDGEDRAKAVAETKAKREELSSSLASLAEQRQQYLDDAFRDNAEAEESLDYQILGSIRKQAKEKGLRYE